MATVIFTGYLALGTGFGPGYAFQEVSGGAYGRVAVNNSGTYSTGTTQTVSSFGAAAAPAGVPMRLGAIFDASSAGHLLAWWELATPLTQVGTVLPSTAFNLSLLGNIIAAMGQGTGEVFQSGSQIGQMNGNPLVAGSTLINSSTGQLTYEPAQGQIVTNPLFYVGGVPVGRFDSSGNLIITGTVTASGTV